MSSCVEKSEKKYQNRDSPPYSAQDCPNQVKQGKNAMYESKPNKNGVYTWRKVKEDVVSSPGRKSGSKSPGRTSPKRESKTKKQCKDEGKLLSPKSKQCIQDTNANRTKLGLKEKPAKPRGRKSGSKSPVRTSPKREARTKKECKDEGKLLSPKSKQCIQDTNAKRKKLGLTPTPAKPRGRKSKSPSQKVSPEVEEEKVSGIWKVELHSTVKNPTEFFDNGLNVYEIAYKHYADMLNKRLNVIEKISNGKLKTLKGKNRELDVSFTNSFDCVYFLPDFEYGPYADDEEIVIFGIDKPNDLFELANVIFNTFNYEHAGDHVYASDFKFVGMHLKCPVFEISHGS